MNNASGEGSYNFSWSIYFALEIPASKKTAFLPPDKMLAI
jgi:hypothetical protein